MTTGMKEGTTLLHVAQRVIAGLMILGTTISLAWADDSDVCTKGRGDEKISACTRAIASERSKGANVAWAYNNRGNAYRSKGDYDRAIQDYDEAIRLDPKYSAAYYNRGSAFDDKGEYDRAIRDYNEAIRLNPK